MKIRLSVLFFFLLSNGPIQAQSTGLPVKVRQKDNKQSNMILLKRVEKGLQLQRKGADEILDLPLSDISAIEFVLPDSWGQAQKLVKQNQFEKAAVELKPIITPLLSYLDLPNSDAALFAMNFADILRQADQWSEAADIYSKIRSVDGSPQATDATLWMAYCLVNQGKLEETTHILKSHTTLKHADPLFGLEYLVRAKVSFAQQHYDVAIDEIAQVIAFSRIEAEWYAESLFISAGCYEALDDKKNASPSSETEGTDDKKNDKKVVKTKKEVAQSIYQELSRGFPNSPWTKKSQSKITPSQDATKPSY